MYKCIFCNKEFFDRHWEGGLIDHENTISNIKVFISRYNKNPKSYKKKFILDCLGLNQNLCSLTDIRYEVAQDKMLCCKKYLELNNHKILASLLTEETLKKEYNKILYRLIQEKTAEVKQLLNRMK